MSKMQIPAALESAIRDGLHTLADNAASDYESWRHGDELEPEEIESEYRDGFIPFTNGGWQCVVPFDVYGMIGSGRYPCEGARELCERLQAEAWRFFPNDCDSSLEAAGIDPADDEAVAHAVANDGRLQEIYSEYERSYCEAVIYLVFRAAYYIASNPRNESGRDEVLLSVYFNDDEWARDKHGAVLFSRNLPVDTLADELPATLAAMRI